MSTGIVLAVLVVLILLVLCWTYKSREAVREKDRYLTGMWIGSPEFLESSDLGSLQIFLSPVENGVRQGYLITTDADDKIITNQAFTYTPEKSGFLSNVGQAYSQAYGGQVQKTVAEFVFDDESEPFPRHMEVTVSIPNGSLTLVHDKTVYAFAFKDHAASHAAIAAWSADN